jgi:RNA polymerase sigma-70 factor (ECF subfamily)
MEQASAFERERGRLVMIAARILDDRHEAEDVVQRAWLRLQATTATIDNLPAWLTTVTTRLCIDRLRERIPVAREPDSLGAGVDSSSSSPPDDPLASIERREAVGQALHVVVDRLSPNERVALVLHESFGFDFETVGEILNRSAAAARKLASRARTKVAGAEEGGPVSDRHIVDAFMAAARGSDLGRLLELLAPDASVSADAEAIASGTPRRIDRREAVAGFFNGSARAALPALIDGRPGAAWFHRGKPLVAFDFTIVEGVVESVRFRAEPQTLESVRRRDSAWPPPPIS